VRENENASRPAARRPSGDIFATFVDDRAKAVAAAAAAAAAAVVAATVTARYPRRRRR